MTACRILPTFNALVKRQEHVSAVFAALAVPTRRRILEQLARRGECRVTALAKPFRMSLPAISRHLRVLENARLVRRQRHGREHHISANAAGLRDAREWILQCAMHWDSRFDALEQLLNSEPSIDRRKEKP